MDVAAPSFAAAGNQQTLAWVQQVAAHLRGVFLEDPGAGRHPQAQVLAAAPRAAVAAARLAVAGPKPGRAPKIRQGIQARGNFQIDGTAAAAVAAVRTAARQGAGAAEAESAIAAAPSQEMDMRLVGEFHGIRGRRAVNTAEGKK